MSDSKIFLSLLFLSYISLISGSACPDLEKWSYFNGYCYLNSKLMTGKITQSSWYTASTICKELGADLVSFHNNDELEFFKNHPIPELRGEWTWTGFASLDFNAPYKWSDGSPTNLALPGIDYRRISKSSCISMKVIAGSEVRFQADDCELLKSFTCKLLSSHTNKTKVLIDKDKRRCEVGWTRVGDRCFKVFSILFSNQRAIKRCLQYNAFLATIRNRMEQEVITMLGGKDGRVWIGLKENVNEPNGGARTFEWMDGSKLTFTNWASHEPNNYRNMGERCVETTSNNGKYSWNDVPCRDKYAVACHKDADYGDSDEVRDEACDKDGYLKYYSGCYKVYKDSDKASWDEAEEKCQSDGGNLISIHNSAENLQLAFKMMQFNGNNVHLAWIGLSHTHKIKSNQWTWSDGWVMNYTNWQNFEPSSGNVGEPQRCAVLIKDGYWKTEPCSNKRPFICEISSVKAPTMNKTFAESCPRNKSEGWVDFGGSRCYRIIEGNHKWVNGENICEDLDSKLASFHSKQELKMISMYLNSQKRNYWIGLYRTNDGFLNWQDNSPLDYFNWIDGNADSDPHKNCVELEKSTLKWKMSDCGYSRNVICSISKIPEIKSSENTSESGTEEGSISSTTIIVACLVGGIVIIIFVVIAIFMKKRSQYNNI